MPSATLNPSDYVVLGMTGLGARSGYEIKRTVERSIRFFWTISPAQVYPSLAKLEQAGLLSGRDEPGGERHDRRAVGARPGRGGLEGLDVPVAGDGHRVNSFPVSCSGALGLWSPGAPRAAAQLVA